MKIRVMAVLLLVAAAICQAPSADAAAILYLDDGVTPTIVGDNLTGDADPTLGSIVFSGLLGSWDITVATGLSKPVLGGASLPAMGLSSNATGSGSLKIALLDDGFTASNFGLRFDFSGSLGAATDMISAIGGVAVPAAPLFELTDIRYFGAFFGPGSFSGVGLGAATLTPADYLFLGVDINSGELSTTSFDFRTAQQVPEPGTVMLLGSGLVGLIGFGRRMSRK